MKKLILSSIMMLSLMLAGQQAMAQGSAQHSVQTLHHSAQASGHAVLAGVKLTSAAVALPLLVVGAVGTASGEAGEVLLKNSEADFSQPLMITDETVTAGPTPAQAVYQDRQ